jgi:hypothetical protein
VHRHWQAWEISRILSQCDPAGNGIDLSLSVLEHVSSIEWTPFEAHSS